MEKKEELRCVEPEIREELFDSYARDPKALSEQDRVRFEQHLENCLKCQTDLAYWELITKE